MNELENTYSKQILADLKNLNYKTREMFKWGNSELSYSDYYQYYNDISSYIYRYQNLSKKYPRLIKPSLLTLNKCPIWLLPILGFLPIYFLMVSAPLFLPIITI